MSAFRPERITVHPDAEYRYDELEAAARRDREPEKAVWKSLQTALARVRADGQWGEVIPRIPAHFIQRYGARNLYCVDLAAFHRCFYTIVGRSLIFLDLVDHRQYDKWFPGRGR